MAATNINRVVLTGNLTLDPELRSLLSAARRVCSSRIACAAPAAGTTRPASGSTSPTTSTSTVWGAQGENCARYLA